MHDLTFDEKAKASLLFLYWLKNKYPTKEVTILPEFHKSPTINFRKGVTAEILSDGTRYKFKIAAERPIFDVLRSMGHEYRHLMQIEVFNIPKNKIKYTQEADAWNFATSAVKQYLDSIGG